MTDEQDQVFLLYRENTLLEVYESQSDAAEEAMQGISRGIEKDLGVVGGIGGLGGTIKIPAITYRIEARRINRRKDT